MEKILYVTDLDGTLLNQKDRINEKSLEIINGLVEEGKLFTCLLYTSDAADD